jgi:hypothetical protein
VAATCLVLGAGMDAQSAGVREVGLRIDLTLQPLQVDGEARWNFDIGAYALFTFGAGWGLRTSAGFDVLHAGPYLALGALRALSPHLLAEGDLSMQWSAGAHGPVSTAGVGMRFAGGSPGGLSYQLAVFPVSWTLASAAGAPAIASFSPSFTFGGGFLLETGLEVSEAVTFTFLRMPTPAAPPVLPLGSDWVLSTRLTSNVGMNFAAAP